MLKLKVAVIVSAMLMTASGMSTPHFTARQAECGGEAIVAGSTPTAARATLPNCDDIDLASPSGMDTEYTCFMPNTGIDALAPAVRADALAARDECAGTISCSASVTPPSASAARSLCAGLAANHTVSALNDGCVCRHIWRGSARYTLCNCNACSPVTFTDGPQDCEAILDSCVTPLGEGGFHVFPDVNAYAVLLLNGTGYTRPVPSKLCPN
ncbi:hypothetical protein C8Q80DRAFT_1125512 [Daedaleopsis nitida]|nr:hypothetical protein C8Q80DRAFT_1125512 [Daedaleopsis nitida]